MGIPFQYTDFHGGLNSKSAPYLLEDNQARDLSNVQGTVAGAIVKRGGLVTLSSPADTLTSLYPFEEVSPVVLVGAGNGKIYKVTSGGTASTIATGLNATARWEFAQMPVSTGQGPLWAMNGVDTPQQWDGVAAGTSNWTATVGAVPNGKYMAVAGNRLWVTGVTANPSRVYFSDLTTNGGARAWPAANVLDLDPNDGQVITGIAHVGPYLLISKARKLFVIYDFDTGANRRLTDTVGCVSHRSMAASPAGTYFLAENRGVYVTNGTKITPLSDNIQPTLDSIQAGLRSQAAGICYNGHYYLSVPINGVANDTTLDWDESLSSWWKHSFGSNQFAAWHPSGVVSLYSAKSTSAKVDQCFVPNVFQDNGVSVPWVWRGPWQSPTFYRRRRFPTPYFRKRLRQVRIDGLGVVDVSCARDFTGTEVLVRSDVFSTAGSTGTFGSASTTYGGTGTFGGAATISRARLYSFGVANAFSMVFGATSNTAAQVESYTLFVADRKDGMTD